MIQLYVIQTISKLGCNVIQSPPKEENKKSIITQMYWWLSKRRSFFIGDDYRIDLVEINRKTGNVKIMVTNLKAEPGSLDAQPQEMSGL